MNLVRTASKMLTSLSHRELHNALTRRKLGLPLVVNASTKSSPSENRQILTAYNHLLVPFDEPSEMWQYCLISSNSVENNVVQNALPNQANGGIELLSMNILWLWGSFSWTYDTHGTAMTSILLSTEGHSVPQFGLALSMRSMSPQHWGPLPLLLNEPMTSTKSCSKLVGTSGKRWFDFYCTLDSDGHACLRQPHNNAFECPNVFCTLAYQPPRGILPE